MRLHSGIALHITERNARKIASAPIGVLQGLIVLMIAGVTYHLDPMNRQ